MNAVPVSAHPWDKVLKITMRVCDGRLGAHGVGLMHSGIKPDNILLSEDGTGKNSEFGIAQARNESLGQDADERSTELRATRAPTKGSGMPGYVHPRTGP